MAARASRRRAGAAATIPDLTLVEAFDIYFDDALTERCPAPGRLRDAMRWAALGPGKRLRPQLVLLACEAVGGDWFHALPAAVAVECVHAFSLAHDDLPAMDDDDYRRGRLTTHRKYGEALGILAGDALLAFAFEELTMLEGAGLRPERVVEALRRLARASGADDLAGGQALDMAAEGRRVRPRDVEAIHLRKTGALMGAALALGGLAGGADPRTVAVLDDAGRLLGFAFQIHDDLLNAGSSLRKLGKRAGTDAARGKATYHRAAGEPAARRKAAALLHSARLILQTHCPRPARLLGLLDALAVRDH
jgi:geranylgeranyl pyrophosphate synthase